MDDLRYFATAESLIEDAPPDKRSAALERLEQLKGSLDPNYGRRFRRRGGREPTQNDFLEVQHARDAAIEIILSLQ